MLFFYKNTSVRHIPPETGSIQIRDAPVPAAGGFKRTGIQLKGGIIMEDTAIIRLFQERSQQAIAELSQKYGKLCQSLSRRILNNEEDA